MTSGKKLYGGFGVFFISPSAIRFVRLFVKYLRRLEAKLRQAGFSLPLKLFARSNPWQSVLCRNHQT